MTETVAASGIGSGRDDSTMGIVEDGPWGNREPHLGSRFGVISIWDRRISRVARNKSWKDLTKCTHL